MRNYILIAVFFACGLVFSVLANNYWLDIMIFAMWYVYLCTTWNIIGGIAGQFNFAHPVYVALGGTLLHCCSTIWASRPGWGCSPGRRWQRCWRW